MLGLEFASDRPTETKSLHCPSGFITGIRVRYGRRAYAPLALSTLPCADASAGWAAPAPQRLRSSLHRMVFGFLLNTLATTKFTS